MTDASASPSAPTPAPEKTRHHAGPLRWIGRIVLALVILVILIVGGAYVMRNTLVKAGVERGGSYATDLKTSLNAADLAIFQGSLTLNGLNIANLQGYKSPDFMTVKSCAVSITKPSSVLTDTVEIEKITIDGVEVTLEQNGMHSNLSDIMDAINKKTPAAGNAANTSPGKKLKIGELDLTNIKVHVRAAPLPNLDLDLGDVVMKDPTNPDGRPMKIADLIGKVLMHLSQQIVNNPAIPGQLKDTMKNVQALVGNMQGELNKDLSGISGLATQNMQNVGKGLQNAGNDLQKDLKGLPDMFGGNKNNQSK